jgi:hypothetical protein
MSAPITGYRILKSTGGNKCIECKIVMRKGLPYMTAVSGVHIKKEKKGKAICISCVTTLMNTMNERIEQCDPDEIDKYEKKRFLEHI